MSVQLHEDFLYFHLLVARNARMTMDRMQEWSLDYLAKYQERAQALLAASRHYQALRAMGPVIEPLLDSMAMAEGLTA